VANGDILVVASQGFRDAASSIVVRDGVWEVCTASYFRGQCAELVPGNYPGIDATLSGRIASARQVGYTDRSRTVVTSAVVNPPVVVNLPQIVVNPAPVVTSAATIAQPIAVNPPVIVSPATIAQPIVVNPPVIVSPATVTTDTRPLYVAPSPVVSVVPPPIGRAILYEDPNFGGAWVAVDRGQANDLDWAHFTNPTHRAASIRVESGTWQFCSDMAFQGQCRVLGPGNYAYMPGGLTEGVASARQVGYPEYGAVAVYRR
jgi:hypothetical protein